MNARDIMHIVLLVNLDQTGRVLVYMQSCEDHVLLAFAPERISRLAVGSYLQRFGLHLQSRRPREH